jgi:eukaryotic-like serine/threonine-protein kinase
MNGRVIAHYRILEKIGAGAMGEVFRARDERLERDVALKLIHPSCSGNPDHLRRFELEARAAGALNHPNIVAIYDFGLDEGAPYIVCELLEGKTLRQRLLEGALPLRLALEYSLQIVQGLIAAHDRRIIHRDLKPENLFVTTEGRIKILDFGVAKLQSGPDESGRTVEDLTTITRSGMVLGTVAYMAPEQLRGKPVDHRSDIFSVGAILYEMLAGRRAFRGETEVDTITAVLRETPPEIGLEQAEIPVSFQQIVWHCLEKDPEKRFQSARDLGFALETLTHASGERAANLVPPKSRTKTLPWALSGALLTALLLLLLGKQSPLKIRPPAYRRVTFGEGTVYSARFAPDFRSVVYGAAWNGKPLRLFSTIGESNSTQAMNVEDANLLALSSTGEMALALHGAHTAHLEIEGGTLARAPLAGGSPREVLEDVRWADWSPSGELAVVHHAEGRDRVEYPLGKVLFQSNGWISHIRLSPQADKIAFINHPSLWDDRGLVCLVDLSGHVTTLSQEWDSADGLAWSSTGKEIWFTAAENGYTRGLLAADAKGNIRTVLKVPGGMTLQDIAPDGRVLVSLDSERIAMATAAREGKAVEISWHDWDIAKDISPDGQSVLFEDASEAAPPNYLVDIRKIDGSPPVQLGEGSAGGLSPDGKWAIAIIVGSPGRITLYPIGPGASRAVPVTGLERIHNGSSHFLADGKRITINGNEPGHGVRCYLLNLDGGKPTPITPEGITGGLVSPDGQFILANKPVNLYPIAGGAPHSIPNLQPDFIPLQWTEDKSSVYGYRGGQIPTTVYKVNLLTGKQTIVRELQPETPTGLVTIAPVVVTRDGSRFAFSYYQVKSALYVISGLQ